MNIQTGKLMHIEINGTLYECDIINRVGGSVYSFLTTCGQTFQLTDDQPWLEPMIEGALEGTILESPPTPYELEVCSRFADGYDKALPCLSAPPSIRWDGDDTFYFVFASGEDRAAFILAC